MINISAKIKNSGPQAVHGVRVDFFIDHTNSRELIGTASVNSSIQVGQTKRTSWISYTLPSPIWDKKNIIAKLNTDNISDENSSNDEAVQNISVYFTDFRMNRDAFSFENPKWDHEVFKSYLRQQVRNVFGFEDPTKVSVLLASFGTITQICFCKNRSIADAAA